MKKQLSFLLAALAFSLSACGGAASTTAEAAPTEAPSATEAPTEAPAESEDTGAAGETPADTAADSSEGTGAATDTTEDSHILVAYFSRSGNTEAMANLIAEQTGGTLFEIAPATPYTDDYDALLDVAQQEQAEDARPALAASVENWDNYDTIFVGYPNWWSDAPMAVYTFLESYDWTGKTLVPFNTSASGGFGRSLDGLAESAAGATILEGLSFTSSTLDDAQSEVTAWLDGLGLS